MFKQLREFLKTLFPDKATEIEALADDKLGDMLPKQPATPPATPTPASTNVADPMVAALAEQVKALQASIGNLVSQNEKSQEQIMKSAKDQKAKEIADLLADAVAKGRIPAKNEELKAKYQKMLEADYDTTKDIISNLPAIAPSGDKKESSGNPNPGTGAQTNVPEGVAFRESAKSALTSLFKQ